MAECLIHHTQMGAIMKPDLTFCVWASHAVIQQLREGESPRDIEASDLVWEPMLTALRTEVQATDRELVLTLLADPNRRMFGGLLSRGLLDDAAITLALVDAWLRSTTWIESSGSFIS